MSNVWLPVLLFVSISINGCFGPFSSTFDPSHTAEAERKIGSDPEYREMDNVCKAIKPPPDSVFVGKDRLFNSVGILYYYRSSVGEDVAIQHFNEILKGDGWKPVENTLVIRASHFRKDNHRIEVTFGPVTSDANISVACLMDKKK